MTEIRLDPVFEALRQPLALIDNEERRRHVEAYLDAARLPLERAVYDALSQAVQGIEEKVGEHYRVRLAYRPSGLSLEVEEKVGDGEEARWTALEGDVEKITIRIPAELKDLATEAAQRAGTSANSWFVKALARAVRSMESASVEESRGRGRHHRSGSRFTGWVGGDDD